VQVWFAPGGQYLTGDYWEIPARVFTGDVEWPHETDGTGKPVLDADGNPIGAAEPAHGTHYHFAPLWLIGPTPAGGLAEGQDCRCLVEPLPCAPYSYGYASTAIGPQLLAGAATTATGATKANG
jgi:hypothetical protein